MVSYKKCPFLAFLPQGLDFFYFFLEVEKFLLVSNILIIIILTIKEDAHQNMVDESSKRIYVKKVH